MHNLRRNNTSVADAYKASKKNLKRKIEEGRRNSRGKFADDNEERLKAAHEDYNRKALEGRLAELVPMMSKVDDVDSDYQMALGMYGAERPVIVKHKEWLQENNGAIGRELICPLCSLKPIEEMDHFAPKSLFPEYSTHLTNLIPLCHSCNHTKDDDWIEHGEQIYFNAYFDIIDVDRLFRLDITLDDGLKYSLTFSLRSNDELRIDEKIYNRVSNTFRKLGLKRSYESALRSILDREISRMTADYRVHSALFVNIRAFQNHYQETWREQRRTNSFDLFTDKMFYGFLLDTPDFTDSLFDRIQDEVNRNQLIALEG